MKAASWNTKWGPRRVRVEPPTIDEALEAASGLTDDTAGQIEMAAQLMGVEAASIKTAAERILRLRARQPETAHVRSGRRTVVVERKAPRRMMVR